jgi:hypothetical protein
VFPVGAGGPGRRAARGPAASGAGRALADFMDAVVIVDPGEYQRRPGEPERPLRTLPFGQAGLVRFLVYEPDDLVLVTRVIWTGWHPPCSPALQPAGVRGAGIPLAVIASRSPPGTSSRGQFGGQNAARGSFWWLAPASGSPR